MFNRDSTGTRRIGTAKAQRGDKLRLMAGRSHCAFEANAWLDAVNAENTFETAGGSRKSCGVAECQAAICPHFCTTSQWDSAALQAVLEVSGGAVTDLQGTPLRNGLDRPVLNLEFAALGKEGQWAWFPSTTVW